MDRNVASWQALTNDKDIYWYLRLSTVSGMSIEFGDENFSLEGLRFEKKFSHREEKCLNEEIEKSLKTGVIKESTHETVEFISSTFLVPKSPDSYPLILNLKKLNEYVPYTYSKMNKHSCLHWWFIHMFPKLCEMWTKY